MEQAIWIMEEAPLLVAFDTKGATFYKGCRGILGSPAEAFLKLIAVQGEESAMDSLWRAGMSHSNNGNSSAVAAAMARKPPSKPCGPSASHSNRAGSEARTTLENIITSA